MAFNISYKFSVIDGFSRNIKKFQIGLKKIGPIMDKVSRKVNRGFKSIASGINRARTSMLVLSAGLTAFGFTAFNSILEFSKGMNILKAVTLSTELQMDSMRKVARELGRTTAFTAGQAANAMGVLGLAGLKTKEIIGAIPSVLSLAAAGGFELKDAAEVLVKAMKGFGLTVKDTKRITDIFAKSATQSLTTVAEMGFSLSAVASIAKRGNVDLETTVAILSVLRNKGIGAAKSSTGLRGAILKLAKITPPAAKVLKRMGINIRNLQKMMTQGRIIEAFEMLGKANLTNARAVAIFDREVTNVAGTMADSTVEIKAMLRSLRNLNSDAKRMADTRLEGLPGAVLIAKSAFESLQLALGKSGLTKRLLEFAAFIKSSSNSLEKLNPNLTSFAVDMGIAFIAATAILIPMQAFLLLMGGLALVFSLPIATIAIFSAGLFLLVGALVETALKWNDLKAAFADRGTFGALGVILGTDIEKSISVQRQLTLDLNANLARRGIQQNLTSKAPATDVNLNGNINVTASGGASVESAEVGISGAGGNLGLNLAGAQ